MKGIVVLSGGMDSAAALAEARATGTEIIRAVHFQYGSKHNAREYSAALRIAEWAKVPRDVINLSFVNELFKSDLLLSGGEVPEGHYEDESMKRTVVPFRNGIMLAIASGLAESLDADQVVLGNHKGDHAIYPDCREEFTVAMGAAMRLGTYKKVTLLTPFGGATKTEIARRGAELGVPFEDTWSCYKGGDNHCGKCGTCVERIEAFKNAGVKDPTTYEVQS